MWKNALATFAVRRSGHTTAGIIRRSGISSGRAFCHWLSIVLLVRVCEGPTSRRKQRGEVTYVSLLSQP